MLSLMGSSSTKDWGSGGAQEFSPGHGLELHMSRQVFTGQTEFGIVWFLPALAGCPEIIMKLPRWKI
jgi:hypothetical protein